MDRIGAPDGVGQQAGTVAPPRPCATEASPIAHAVPNISEGRDGLTIEAAADACRAAGARVLNLHADVDHNRSVLTLAGRPEFLAEATVALARECRERIDLSRHEGVHPCIGALDVLPFVARTPADRPVAETLARGVAERIGAELEIPVFLYGTVARDPVRVRPHHFRAGGWMELARRVAAGELVPDAGPRRLHPTAGAVLVGVRAPLIALNLALPGASLDQARALAARVREAGGGPTGVRALGLQLARAGCVQLSLNIEDHVAAPLPVVIGAARRAGAALGVSVGEAELVGLIPRAALAGASPAQLGIVGFRPGMVVESQFAALGRNA